MASAMILLAALFWKGVGMQTRGIDPPGANATGWVRKAQSGIRVHYEPMARDLEGHCHRAVWQPLDGHLVLTHFRADSSFGGEDTLCIAGRGVQSRGDSTAEMIWRAAAALPAGELPYFGEAVIDLSDLGVCGRTDFAYVVRPGCAALPIPDFTFFGWPEAGLLPNFTSLAQEISVIGSAAPARQQCGWAGNVGTHRKRRALQKMVNGSDALSRQVEIVAPRCTTGVATARNGRISMQEQVRRWACLLDVQGAGYSGRVPLLLHSGRPLLVVGRTAEEPLDSVWYGRDAGPAPIPWEHFVPVRPDLSDLQRQVQWVLRNPTKSGAIAVEGRRFAQEHFTLDSASRFLAKQLQRIGDVRAARARMHVQAALTVP